MFIVLFAFVRLRYSLFSHRMRRLITALVLFYYVAGTLVFPLGDFSYLRDLPQMYARCAQEDPDIDLGDFIVEHLLNIQDDDEHEAGERPHQPVYGHMPVQVVATFETPQAVISGQRVTYATGRSYPIFTGSHFKNTFKAQLLRPPIPSVA